MKLMGRTALVTGASRGIGRAIAIGLAEEGADVAVNYVSNEVAAQEVFDQIAKLGRRGVLARADVGDYPDTYRMAQQVLKEFGHLDILVNNAGVNDDKTFVKMDHAAWRKVLSINLDGVFNCTKVFVELMAIPEKVQARLLQQIPLGRFARAEEVARAVVYIVSADGDYITGAELSINGGLLM